MMASENRLKDDLKKEEAHPEIYEEYPDNLAGRGWLARLFATSANKENTARHAEWEKRTRLAADLKLPPPPPPNEFLLKGG